MLRAVLNSVRLRIQRLPGANLNSGRRRRALAVYANLLKIEIY